LKRFNSPSPKKGEGWGMTAAYSLSSYDFSVNLPKGQSSHAKELPNVMTVVLRWNFSSCSLGLMLVMTGFWANKSAIAQESLYQAPLQSAQVIRVVNGDTVALQLETQQRIRVQLACIAAPEPKGGFYGKRAKEALAERLPENTSVQLLLVAERRFLPPIAVLYRSNAALQPALVAAGAAQIDTRNLELCTQIPAYQGDTGEFSMLSDALLRAEAQAKQDRVGLWAQVNPIPPWEVRDGTRNLLLFGGGVIVALISGAYSIQYLVQEWRDRKTPQIASDEEAPMSLRLSIQAFQTDLSNFLSDMEITEQFVKQLESVATPEDIAEVYRHFRYAAHTAISTLGMGAVFPVYRDIARLHYSCQGHDPVQAEEYIDRDLRALKFDHNA